MRLDIELEGLEKKWIETGFEPGIFILIYYLFVSFLIRRNCKILDRIVFN